MTIAVDRSGLVACHAHSLRYSNVAVSTTCLLVSSILLFFCWLLRVFFFFFFNDTATTEIYTLSLHDALPISRCWAFASPGWDSVEPDNCHDSPTSRSEEHTSELQSQSNLVCRLLLEKKKKNKNTRLLHDRAQTPCLST